MISIQTILSFLTAVDECEDTFRGIVDQRSMCVKKMAEVLKEFSKEDRRKGCFDHIVEEEIDLLNALFIDLRRRGVSFKDIFSGTKLKRAVSRYRENGEL